MGIFNKELDSSEYIAKLNRKAKDYSKTTPEDNLKVRRWHKTYVLYNEIAKLSNFDNLSNSHKDAIVSAGLSYLTQIMESTDGRYNVSGHEEFNTSAIYFLNKCSNLNKSNVDLIKHIGKVEYSNNQILLNFATILDGIYDSELDNFRLVLNNIFEHDRGYNIWNLLESTALYKLTPDKIDVLQKLVLNTCTEIDYDELNNYGGPSLVADIVNKVCVFNAYCNIHEPETIAYLGMFYKDLMDYRIQKSDPADNDAQMLFFSEQILKNMLNPLVDMKLDTILKIIELTGSNTFEHWVSTVLKEETPVVDFDFNQ